MREFILSNKDGSFERFEKIKNVNENINQLDKRN